VVLSALSSRLRSTFRCHEFLAAHLDLLFTASLGIVDHTIVSASISPQVLSGPLFPAFWISLSSKGRGTKVDFVSAMRDTLSLLKRRRLDLMEVVSFELLYLMERHYELLASGSRLSQSIALGISKQTDHCEALEYFIRRYDYSLF